MRRHEGDIFRCMADIGWVMGLPKTCSGKIMRRILRKIAEGQPGQIGNPSTLADPSLVEHLWKNK